MSFEVAVASLQPVTVHHHASWLKNNTLMLSACMHGCMITWGLSMAGLSDSGVWVMVRFPCDLV